MARSSTTPPPPPISPPHNLAPFRFKRAHLSDEPTISSSTDPKPKRRRHHHYDHHHSSRSHHRSHHHRSRPKSLPHDTNRDFSPLPTEALDPDTAFRESLFDAMADDEGAAFWQGVYGQPIHTYSPYRLNADGSTSKQDEEGGAEATGELERMTDEEYTAYVRARMWEKSHGYIVEERAKRDADRKRRREREKAEAEAEAEEGRSGYGGRRRARGIGSERAAWDAAVDEVLGRRQKTAQQDAWTGVWQEYVRGWAELTSKAEEAALASATPASAPAPAPATSATFTDASTGTDASTTSTTTTSASATATAAVSAAKQHSEPRAKKWKPNSIPWPTSSGKLKDVNDESVALFLRNAPQTEPKRGVGAADLLPILKAERVRWHPDKMQQRYGALGIDAESMRGVTAVFQVVDRLWTESREIERGQEGKGA